MDARLYTAKEIAEITHIHIKRVHKYMKSEMRCIKDGRTLKTTMEEILRWEREKMMTHSPEPAISRKERNRARTAQLEQYARMAQMAAASGGKIPYRK